MPIYDDYEDLLQSINFIGGADQTELSGILFDPRTDVDQSNGKWEIYYFALSNYSDMLALNYYNLGDSEEIYIPLNSSSAKDPSVSASQSSAIQDILQANLSDYYSGSFEDIVNIEFIAGDETNAHIVYGQTTSGGSAPTYGTPGYEMDASDSWNSLKHGDIWLNKDSTDFWDENTKGSFGYWGIMHETAHSLGLGHTADDNANDITGYDDQKYSIMSYNPMDGMDPTGADNEVTPFGLQLMDIAALQEIYGRNYDTRNTSTTYSAATAFASSRPNGAFIYTIWDGGGTDTIDASGYTDTVILDLRQGNFSSVGKNAEGYAATDNLAIAYYAIIENAIGTSANDILIGNAWDNEIHGGGGHDRIFGDGLTIDDDAVIGAIWDNSSGFIGWESGSGNPAPALNSSGDDYLYGEGGDDYLYGGNGADYLYGGTGEDHLYGGGGVDYVYGGDGNDTLYGYEEIEGIEGDFYYGGDGIDMLDYSGAGHLEGVEIDLATGTAKYRSYGSLGDTDYFTGIEVIKGSNGSDRIFGDTGNNIFWTGGGNDLIHGGEGSDTYIVDLDKGGSVYALEYEYGGGSNDTIEFTAENLEDYNFRIDAYNYAQLKIYSGIYHYDNGISYFSSGTTATLAVHALSPHSQEHSGFESIIIGSATIAPIDIQPYDHLDPVLYSFNLTAGLSVYNGGYESLSDMNVGAFGVGISSDGMITSVKTDRAMGLNWIDAAHGSEALHPWIVTAFSGGPGYSTMSYESFVKEIGLNSAVSLDDIHITADGNTTGYASLNITIGSSFSFTIPDFEAGKTINGIAVFDGVIYDSIAEAMSSTLQRTGTGTYSATYDKDLGILGGSVSETYFFEKLNYGNGSIDMTGTLTFNGTNGADTIHGLNTRGDIMQGNEGSDYLYSYGGNDTLIGGDGADFLYGGAEDDTYSFDTGFGADYIYENLSEGFDTIRLLNIDATDIRMTTDSYGTLYIADKNNAGNSITVYAGTEGYNETTIRDVMERIVFDDTTVWDLTGALTLEGDSSNDSIYGTQFDDVLLGMGGYDSLFGNRGNDNLVGGEATDYLYGGEGDDTYSFDTGFGADFIYENLSEGFDTIRFLNIDAADIRLWTDSYGTLYLEDKNNISNMVTIYAGTEGYNETTIRDVMERIVFDDTSVWDLTGALTLEGNSSNDALYGTQFDDMLLGLDGYDSLAGNRGNDTLIGGVGGDQLYGGEGDDTYSFDTGFGADFIYENVLEGDDTIRFLNTDAADIRLWTDSYGTLYLEDKNNASNMVTVYSGTEGYNESLIRDQIEQIVFDDSTIWDLTGALTLEGNSSNDALYGTKFDDILLGLDGYDSLSGNRGNDTLIGGAGSDNLTGGEGADTFLLDTAALGSIDYINDFSFTDGDKLDISQLLFGYDPLTSLIDDFITMTDSSGNTDVAVDRDGTGTAYSSESIAVIYYQTGMDADSMLTNGNLIAA